MKLKNIFKIGITSLLTLLVLMYVANASIGGGGISGIPYLVNHDFSPSVDSSYDLGSNNLRWKKIWADDGDFTSITIGGASDGAIIIDVDDAEAFLVRKDGDAGDVFIVNTQDERIGIGTTSPDTLLSVAGNSHITGTSTIDGYNLVGNTFHAYGVFQNATTTINLTEDVWATTTNATGDLWTGLEADGMSLANDVMTINNAGDYYGTVSLSISGNVNQNMSLRLYNVTEERQEGYIITITTKGANTYSNIVLPVYIEDSGTNSYIIQIRNSTSGADVTLYNSIFYINYLHQ